ncbi:hypothetical protein LTSEINV_6432 [Salmonella enterica subsp. enterica serovar Inverness str. R8-3668]|uniref:Uncharacterized protein n=1 Tax=Salmonella enterica subsp. enterica serovar Inverness str. R8-3668 TaxID=913075 RepID=G5NMQ1_SALET|nr:hypothetical protein LTSEINV_6432 [Salmonella enterica subsp. enterica serovar Inverness str. R8-3668]
MDKVTERAVTTNMGDVVNFKICFKKKVSGENRVYPFAKTTVLIATSDQGYGQGCPGDDALLRQPVKQMFSVASSSDVLS